MSENGEIYTAGKNFILPPAVTGVTNSTSAWKWLMFPIKGKKFRKEKPKHFWGENRPKMAKIRYTRNRKFARMDSQTC